MRGSRLLAALCFGLALVLSVPAAADEAQLSDFERETRDRVTARLGALVDPEPGGKVVEAVEVVTIDVFTDEDPIPNFFNVFHTTTRERVVRQELLLRPGQHFDQRLVDESARNLRSHSQLSLVLIVPVAGSAPDRVRLLVITRDTWSLRINLYYEAAAPADDPSNIQLSQLILQPAEVNLAGTHTQASLMLTMDPDTYSMGVGFADPRLHGSRVRTSTGGSVVVNRASGQTEGSFGHLIYGQPLFSVDSRWGWGLFVSWRADIARVYDGIEIRTFDADATVGEDAIPMVFERDEWLGEYELVRSFGTAFKHDVAFGVQAMWDRYEARAPADAAPVAVDEYVREEVPVTDKRLGPYVQLRSHGTEFHRVLDVDTLGLQEDYRLGPELTVRLYPATQELGASRDMVGTFAAASYTVALGDGLARAIAGSTAEFGREDESDVLFEGYARLVSPRLGIGRLVYDGLLVHRYRDYLNIRASIGGDDRLRGYPANRFRGKDLIASNLEFRTAAVPVLSTRLGGVLFYDVGDAFDGFEDLDPNQSIGFGLRVLFPQLDRMAMRLDWGFPIDGTDGLRAGFINATFGQALPMRRIRRTGAADHLPTRTRASMLSSPLHSRAGERL